MVAGWVVVGVLATVVIFGATIAVPIVLVPANPNPPNARFARDGSPAPPPGPFVAQSTLGTTSSLPPLPTSAPTPVPTTAPIVSTLSGSLEDYPTPLCVNKVAAIWLLPSMRGLAPESPAAPGDMVRRIGLSGDGKLARITFRGMFPRAAWMRVEDLSVRCDGLQGSAAVMHHAHGGLLEGGRTDTLPALEAQLKHLREAFLKCGEDVECGNRAHAMLVATVRKMRALRRGTRQRESEERRRRDDDETDGAMMRERHRRRRSRRRCGASCQRRRALRASRQRLRQKLRAQIQAMRALHVRLAQCGTDSECEHRVHNRIVRAVEVFRLLGMRFCSGADVADAACRRRVGRAARAMLVELSNEESSLHSLEDRLRQERQRVREEEQQLRIVEARRRALQQQQEEAAAAAAAVSENDVQEIPLTRGDDGSDAAITTTTTTQSPSLTLQQQEENEARLAAVQRTEEQEALTNLQARWSSQQGAAASVIEQQIDQP